MFAHITRQELSRLAAAAITTAALLIPSAGGALAARAHDSVSLTLVAYSTPQKAYLNSIIPAFQKTTAGKNITFQTSFGASGDQSRAVLNGLNADIVAFSLEPDINRLVKAGLVAGTWYKNAYHGFVTNSIVVFVVRKGNPKHIKTWADLVKPGIDVIVPNPFQSGGAQWDIMAAYGAQIAQKKSAKQATAYLTSLYSHISVQDKSASISLQTFLSGKGDVLLSYENEALAAQAAGSNVDYVIPPQTILIQNPVAVVKTGKHLAQANAFVKFLWSKTAQNLYGENGYRPVVASVLKKFFFKNPKTLFTIQKLGSWPAVETRFFDPTNGIVAKIERSKGVSP
jgi:sulfate transport system substrate-binding protein